MRVVQPQGARGSLKWLQRAVNERPDLLASPRIGPITWVSPLIEDGYAEYRDAAFLKRVGLERLASELSSFWPARGPQWDALGTSGDKVILVEAKAYLAEMFSPPSAAGKTSLPHIERALEEVRDALGAKGGAPWTQTFYQFANRLAHLHFLRSRGVEAHLLLVGFVADRDMNGPSTAAEWRAAYQVAEYAMGLKPGHRLATFVHHVHPDVSALA